MWSICIPEAQPLSSRTGRNPNLARGIGPSSLDLGNFLSTRRRARSAKVQSEAKDALGSISYGPAAYFRLIKDHAPEEITSITSRLLQRFCKKIFPPLSLIAAKRPDFRHSEVASALYRAEGDASQCSASTTLASSIGLS
ncbi:uncharacterized protein BO80DRAFT_238558 [Aspergillus ibericus CBS 121593]|uniref:Uncharacterized protein n=1 Tax=Aspergillus ibericus CBS 121593 TaxID=1448316 RepID=A0A395GLJ0_9EURO|nr:hypothetical protein BO80DRAFT_238558 [Aspergillus ibericus CBS 121593]RAK96254.1 hypothetical protein BO80DRAFT_238558 [Aspergillus ibericus CBS 121593]